jgi:hypothetical protein
MLNLEVGAAVTDVIMNGRELVGEGCHYCKTKLVQVSPNLLRSEDIHR